jgi:hypothetical protein
LPKAGLWRRRLLTEHDSRGRQQQRYYCLRAAHLQSLSAITLAIIHPKPKHLILRHFSLL